MQKKTRKKIIIIVSILIIIGFAVGIVGAKVYNDGFKLFTYTTENRMGEQIENIIGIDDGKDYEGKVEEISIKEIDGDYLGFFHINDDEEKECIIAKYKKSFDLGKHNVLNLDRIIKSGNSVSMIELSKDDNNNFVILLSPDLEKYESFNIVSSNNNEVIENIPLTDEAIKEFNGEILKNNVYLIQYKTDEYNEIGIELVKKSEE